MNRNITQNTNSIKAFNNQGMKRFGLFFTVIALVIVSVFGVQFAMAQNTETVSCTVTSKERVTEVSDGNSDTRFLINTNECGTLEIGSAIISGNWTPNKTYSAITEGETYTFEVYGFNIDFLDIYKQVKSVN